MVAVFAYGSLMYAPELPGALSERIPARLFGHRRDFAKRSGPRGCPSDEARWQVEGVPAAFREGGHRYSLALGTRAEGALDGLALLYPEDVEERLLLALDRREGVVRGAPDHEQGYQRRRVTLQTAAGTVRAWAWLSNPGGRWHAADLSLEAQARILLHATPRDDRGRSLGVHYLLDTCRAARRAGVRDPYLDALLGTVQALPGPWQQDLAEACRLAGAPSSTGP